MAQSAQKAKELATKMSKEATPSKREKRQLYEYYQDMMDTEGEAIAEEEKSAARQQRLDGLEDKARNLLARNKTTAEQTADSEQESISRANVPEQYQTAKNNTSYVNVKSCAPV